jgi:hypothetical protein
LLTGKAQLRIPTTMRIPKFTPLILLAIGCVGCNEHQSSKAAPASNFVPKQTAEASTIPNTKPSSSPSSKVPPATSNGNSGEFRRKPPHHSGDAVDACLQVGGNYFSCSSSYYEETDDNQKQYLLRIAKGQAAGISNYKHRGEKLADNESMPHAEVPWMCDPSKTCSAKTSMGELNKATNCLGKAYEMYLKHHEKEAKVAHAHACKCDPKNGLFPAYNGSAFICDKSGRPAFLSPTMSEKEGADIVDCGLCHPKRGPEACQREIKRLTSTHPKLAEYINKRQIPRCQNPAQGMGDWTGYP